MVLVVTVQEVCKIYKLDKLVLVRDKLVLRNLPIAVESRVVFGDNVQLILPIDVLGLCNVSVRVAEHGIIDYVDVVNLLGRTDLYCVPVTKRDEECGEDVPFELKGVNAFAQCVQWT